MSAQETKQNRKKQSLFSANPSSTNKLIKSKLFPNDIQINQKNNINENIVVYNIINNYGQKEKDNENYKNKLLEFEEKFTLNDQELNTLGYKKAILYDQRTYFQYYISLLKKKQIILFTFWPIINIFFLLNSN